MWAQVQVTIHRVTHQKKEKKKMSRSRVEVTRVEMMKLMKKKKNQ